MCYLLVDGNIMIGLFSKRLSPSHKVRSENGSQKCRKGFVSMLNAHWVSYKREGEWCNARHSGAMKQSGNQFKKQL
jgi:hypothetical protein